MNTDRLLEGQSLVKGDYIINAPKTAVLVLQKDGNLVLYRVSDKAALWATNTVGQGCPRATPHRGNFELYKPDNSIAWTSAWDADWKWGNGTLILQEDGDLTVRSGNQVMWNSYTYGLRFQSDNKKTGWRPLHILDVPAGAISAVGHWVPGVDWFGDELKDFANSTGGKIVMTAFTTMNFDILSSAIGVFTIAAPQIASLTFAIPGLARGEPFFQAWLTEFLSRVKQTIEILGADVGAAVGKEMMAQIQPAYDQITKALGNSTDVLNKMITNLEAQGNGVEQIAKLAGVRTDVFQSAIDAAKKQVTSFGKRELSTLLGDVNVLIQEASDGLLFDPLTGDLDTSSANNSKFATIDAEREASALKQGIQFMAGIAFVGLEKAKNPKWTIDMPKLYIWDEQPDGSYMGLTHNLTTGKWKGPGVLLADYLKHLKQLQVSTISAGAIAALSDPNFVPTSAQIKDANAKIAAAQAIQLLDPNSWLSKQKVLADTVAKSTLAASITASANKLNQYFTKYTALAKGNLK